MELVKLYTRDLAGNLRFWQMQINPEKASQYRTVSGIVGGAEVASDWVQAYAKNLGRSNETTAEEQATLEIEALYRHKLDRKYYSNAEDAKSHKFNAPMLAQKYENWDMIFTKNKIAKQVGNSVYVQPKLDGMRCVFSSAGAFSRQGKPFEMEHLSEHLAPLFKEFPDLILDGELYNHELRDDFNQLSSLIRKTKRSAEETKKVEEIVQFHIYDVFQMPTPYEPNMIFYDRNWFIDTHVGTLIRMSSHPNPPIRLVPTFKCYSESQIEEIYSKAMELGYEGAMIRANTPYEVGKRSYSLLKHKEFIDEEFELVKVEEGRGNWSGKAKTAEIRLKDGRTQSAGMRGNEQFLEQLLKEASKYKYVTVRYQNLTPDGFLRFPIITDWHETERND